MTRLRRPTELGRSSALFPRQAGSWRIATFRGAVPSAEDIVGLEAAVTVSFADERARNHQVAKVVNASYGDPPVDVVVTWVDGDDPVWREARAAIAHAHGGGAAGTGVNDEVAQGSSHEDLRFALRAIARNAGWARRIVLVTSGQRPPWLCEDGRLVVVTHDELMPADALPTFNSHAIEASLHHIPGLSEHFVYVNDDVFLARATHTSTFFTESGQALVFEGPRSIPCDDERVQSRVVDAVAARTRSLVEARFGRRFERQIEHAPFALRASVMRAVEAAHPDLVGATVHSRFRSTSDVSLAASLAPRWAVCTGDAEVSHITAQYVNAVGARLPAYLTRIRYDRRIEAFCINDTDQVEIERRAARSMIESFLGDRFPTPSPWELAR